MPKTSGRQRMIRLGSGGRTLSAEIILHQTNKQARMGFRTRAPSFCRLSEKPIKLDELRML
jgi:hypothetical protein